MRSAGLLVLLLLGLALTAASATAKTTASFEGTIAYEVYSNKTAWLEAMDLATGKVRQLTKPVAGGVAGGPYESLTWSPDGEVLAFTRTARDGRNSVYGLDAVTGKLQNLTAAAGGGGYGELTWSPDGKSLAFSRATRVARSGIYVVRRGGSWLRLLNALPFYEARSAELAWSSDGSKLAYTRGRSDEDGCGFDLRIFVTSVASGVTIAVPALPSPGLESWQSNYFDVLAWQPHGDQLLYAVSTESYSEGDDGCDSDNEATAIYSVTPPDTASTLLLGSSGNLWDAIWSPNGKTIAYANFTNQNLAVMDSSGKNKRVLLADGDYWWGWDLAWTPNSKGILEGAQAGVGIKNVATRRYRVLATWKEIDPEGDEGGQIFAVGKTTVAAEAGSQGRPNYPYDTLSQRVVIASLAGGASRMVTLKPSASKVYLGELAVTLP